MRAGLAVLALPVTLLGLLGAGWIWAIPNETPHSSPLVRAQELFDAGNYREAEKLLVGRPSTDARYLLGRVYAHIGLLEDARDLLESVVTEKPEARRLLVKVCLDRADFDRAAPHVRALQAEDPKNADLARLAAHVESKVGNPAAALAAASRLLELNPSDPAAGMLVAELANEVSKAAVRTSPTNLRSPLSFIGHPPSTPKEIPYGSRSR